MKNTVKLGIAVAVVPLAIIVGLLVAPWVIKEPEDVITEVTAPLPTPPIEATQQAFRNLLLREATFEDDALEMADYGLTATEPCDEPPAIFDMYGTPQDVAWLRAKYGDALTWSCTDPHPEAEYVFRLTELRESCGPAVFIVNVENDAGAPLQSKAVIRYWPGAPALPQYDPPASRYTDVGIVGWTSASGDVGFGVGHGDAYFPETSQGATQFYIADYDGPSDWLKGIGWLDGTEHCTMFSVWARIPADTIVPPTPTPGPTDTPGPTVTPGPGPTLPVGEGLFELDGVYIRLVPVGTPAP